MTSGHIKLLGARVDDLIDGLIWKKSRHKYTLHPDPLMWSFPLFTCIEKLNVMNSIIGFKPSFRSCARRNDKFESVKRRRHKGDFRTVRVVRSGSRSRVNVRVKI